MERLTPTVRALVIAVTLGYLLFVFTPGLNPWMLSHLFLGPGFVGGEVWQPVTALFLHVRVLGWFFTVIGLWWVGAFIERVRGPRFFIKLLLGAGVLANVAAALVSLVLPGSPGAVRTDGAGFALTAVFVAFARIYGARPAQIWGSLSMRADYFTWILIGFSLLVAIANQDWPGIAAELSAIGVALAVTGGVRDLLDKWRADRTRGRYRVLDGGKRKPTHFN
ncbi:MAG: rhomboid family intramembrane serine protease [Verrucomicrobiota bacterium]